MIKDLPIEVFLPISMEHLIPELTKFLAKKKIFCPVFILITTKQLTKEEKNKDKSYIVFDENNYPTIISFAGAILTCEPQHILGVGIYVNSSFICNKFADYACQISYQTGEFEISKPGLIASTVVDFEVAQSLSKMKKSDFVSAFDPYNDDFKADLSLDANGNIQTSVTRI